MKVVLDMKESAAECLVYTENFNSRFGGAKWSRCVTNSYLLIIRLSVADLPIGLLDYP